MATGTIAAGSGEREGAPQANAPPEKVAEVLHGVLHLHPRPAKPHAAAATALGEELGPPFKRGRGGPGGGILLDEPELHLGDDILVPDLGGWRRERMPYMTDDKPYFTLAPLPRLALGTCAAYGAQHGGSVVVCHTPFTQLAGALSFTCSQSPPSQTRAWHALV